MKNNGNGRHNGLAYLKEEKSRTVAIYPAINKLRLAGKGHPEEAVRLGAYNSLIQDYHYPSDLIDIEFPVLIREDEQPRFADIVTFDDRAHKRPFIVCETKKPNREDGEKQGQRYATILRAVYVLWTNGTDRSASAIVNRYPEDAAPIADIPEWGGLPKLSIELLTPFSDDKHVTGIFRKCHNLIRAMSHLKPDDAFTEFLKVLMVKIQDEQKGADFDFQVFLRGTPSSEEPVNETAQRVRLLFKYAVEEDADVASAFKRGDDISLTNDCITQIVRELQRFSFATTPVDQKGRAFETFISGDLRQEFKEFMTPRPVIEAMVQWANPDISQSILDPCCGSAAFLIYSLDHIRKTIERRSSTQRQKVKLAFDYAHDKLWGFDTSPQMSAVARINMLVNEDGRAHIFNHDSLQTRSNSPDAARGKLFHLILTNPPFGKRIPYSSTIAERFPLVTATGGKITKRGFLTEILFLERNLEWLHAEGRMLIVLPDSVLGNSTLAKCREQIEKVARLVGVISLSPDTFGPSGAKSKTSVVIFQKRSIPVEDDDADDYPVFVAHVPEVGYDFTGRATGKDDLKPVTQAFLTFSRSDPIDNPLCAIIQRSELGSVWLAQPHVNLNRISKDGPERSLSNLCAAISTGKTAPRNAYVHEGVHIVKVGNLTGHGIEWNAVERQYVTPAFAAKYPHIHLRRGDVLFTAGAHGPKWIGLKVDIFEGPPPGQKPPIICCGEVMLCRLRKDAPITPYHLLMFLRSSAGYEAIQRCIRGQSGHIYPDAIGSIVIPKMNNKDKNLIAAVKAIKRSLTYHQKAAAEHATALTMADKLFPSNAKKPIIAL
jgi:type I restriction enzyme M protein